MQRALAPIACALLAGLAGAMSLIRIVLVPLWRSMPADDFRVWFRGNSGRIGMLMFPLGAAATVSSVAAATLDPDRGSKAAAAACLSVTCITLVVNEPANVRFASAEVMAPEETEAALATWARWHNLRVALGVTAVIAAVARLRRSAGHWGRPL